VNVIAGRLFNYGIGIHLLQSEDPDSLPEKREINPKGNHISFQVKRLINPLSLSNNNTSRPFMNARNDFFCGKLIRTSR
jgi:hypothetical protein